MTLTRPKARRSSDGSRIRRDEVPVIAYEADAYGWSLQQAQWLREGQFDRIDRLNVADEIADLAKREFKAARSALRLVLQHLLKWDGQPERRSRSWVLSIRTQRRDVIRQLGDNPGLRPLLPKLVAEAYADARDGALYETGLAEQASPLTCPYSWDDIMTRPVEWIEQP